MYKRRFFGSEVASCGSHVPVTGMSASDFLCWLCDRPSPDVDEIVGDDPMIPSPTHLCILKSSSGLITHTGSKNPASRITRRPAHVRGLFHQRARLSRPTCSYTADQRLFDVPFRRIEKILDLIDSFARIVVPNLNEITRVL